MSDLIDLSGTPGLRIALAYATPDNLSGRAVYRHGAHCALRPEAAECLQRAIRGAARAGFTLQVFDAYRPEAAQRLFWSKLPDPRYIADPAVGSNHTRGVAIDLTLLDEAGKPLEMGTGFDAMCDQSHQDRDDISLAAQRNRAMLLGIMLHAGFTTILTEWWHFQLPNAEQRFALIPADPLVQVQEDLVPVATAA